MTGGGPVYYSTTLAIILYKTGLCQLEIRQGGCCRRDHFSALFGLLYRPVLDAAEGGRVGLRNIDLIAEESAIRHFGGRRGRLTVSELLIMVWTHHLGAGRGSSFSFCLGFSCSRPVWSFHTTRGVCQSRSRGRTSEKRGLPYKLDKVCSTHSKYAWVQSCDGTVCSYGRVHIREVPQQMD